MENKNTILALVLMLIVWSGFTYFFPTSKVENLNVQQGLQEDVVQAESVQSTVPKSSLPPVFPIGNYTEKNITVENDKFIIKLSTEYASPVSLVLKDYTSELGNDDAYVEIIDQQKKLNALVTSLNGITDSHYDTSADAVNYINSGELLTISFQKLSDTGLQIVKNYVFRKDSYDIDYSVFVRNGNDEPFVANINIDLVSAWDSSTKVSHIEFVGPVTFSSGNISTDDVSDLKDNTPSYSENVIWSGFETKYFLSAVISPEPAVIDTVTLHLGTESVINKFSLAPFTLNTGGEASCGFKLYFGPKDVSILEKSGYDLVKVVDFGFFKLLAKPLHLVLNFFYSYIGNYGIAIILLTIILKLIFWPLTQKSYVSMRAMQTLQPEMKKLRDKYSSDKETLNKKMMELYKEHRVNPLGGCLPMLVQIPVFFALYKVLLDTIELRHAPFAFWITDLSIKDPYYITPVVMGVTMFIQQKMSPSTMDPIQAKMMMAMPVVFTFLFLNFPSGLVIYWLVNNLLTILQQYLIYRKPV